MSEMAIAIPERELEATRRRAFGVAYRMLGSVSEAEDVAQEAVLRLAAAEHPIGDPMAWITPVATRLSMGVLRLARNRRESYVGPWLPEPLIGDAASEPGRHAELADSLSQAFLVLLERLTPLERAAFLLREVFDYDHRSIARALDRSEANSRQLVTRARKHLESRGPRFEADEELRDRMLELFLAAAEDGDVQGLERLLADDAILYSDGGGKVIASRRPLHGAGRIARAMVAVVRKQRRRGPFEMQLVTVNGQPGRILRTVDGGVWDVLSIDVADGRIQTVRIVRNPDKLAHV